MQLLASEAAARSELMEWQLFAVEVQAVGPVRRFAANAYSHRPLNVDRSSVAVDDFASVARGVDSLLQLACDR